MYRAVGMNIEHFQFISCVQDAGPFDYLPSDLAHL